MAETGVVIKNNLISSVCNIKKWTLCYKSTVRV